MTTAATTESPSKGATTSLEEYMRVQQDLVREASLALPHSFSQCTYSLGYIRQPVYLCQTCPEAKGVCASCSIACHADHEQIELFPKRHFRCDCPTTSIAHSCTLHRRPELENEENQYGQNFQGLFCRCHRTYDAATEREAMIQCLACEDWFHESCCNLRERPPPRGSTPPPEPTAQSLPSSVTSLTTPSTSADTAASNTSAATTAPTPSTDPASSLAPSSAPPTTEGDAASDTSDNDLPPALITPDHYEAFVCGACVQRIEVLKRYAGSAEAVMVGRGNLVGRGAGQQWVKIDGEDADVDIEGKDADVATDGRIDEGQPATGEKRRLDEEEAAQEPKRRRVSEQPEGEVFTAQTPGGDSPAPRGPAKGTSSSASGPETSAAGPRTDTAGKILEAVARGDYSLGTGDVFLTREDFRERWCRCEDCLPLFLANKFLLEDEETWEPPEDEDSGRSLEELGLRALNNLPRDRAIDGIMHFNALKDHLVGYLRPFAQEGKVVGETDVRSFFAELMAARAKPGL
ncbi:hypothetical protein K523DRAFT_338091 [Schizophyllum commune Tattone D]|nr:hypothetical protein K523DRAFT_338091 [Schizophyllum commune Tattone D]